MSGIERMNEVQKAMAELERVKAEAAALGTDLERPISRLDKIGEDAPSMKIELARKRDAVTKMQAELRRAASDLEDAMRIQMQEARQFLEPLEKQVKMMQEGIWTINLYLGRDEEIQVLREGEPASFDVPISVRQMVLSMDQECAAYAEDGGIDAASMKVFTKWLLEDEANLKQVFPEERGVVVMVPRITEKDYGNPWQQDSMDKANTTSYWLLRNGEKLWLMTTDIKVGTHLIPTATEFTKIFEMDRWGHEIKPGSREWLEAEEKADGRKRHYMRIAMVLQGLVDRTTVFHPMVPGISFLTPDSYDSGSVRVITDAERAIGDGLEPFRQWHARITKEMRPGMRIIGAFNGQAWYRANHEDEYDRRGRLSIAHCSAPVSGEIYTLESAGGKRLKFVYQRTDKRWGYEHLERGRYWGRYGEWEFARKGVSCEVLAGDGFLIPLDLVTVPEMKRYLSSRVNRTEYIDMLPLLRTAIEAKQAETLEEAPFRQLLTSNLMKASGDDLETVGPQLDDLIRWYKLGNRWHRALVGQTREEQKHALLQIKAEYMRRRVAHRDDSEESQLVAKVKLMHPTVAFIGRYHDGTYLSYEPQAGAERTNSVGVFFTRRRWTKTGKLAKDGVTEWICPKVAKMRSLFETEAWTGRPMRLNERDRWTGPEFDEIIEHFAKTPEVAVVLAAPNRDNGCFYLIRSEGMPEIPEHLLTENFPYFPIKYSDERDWKRTKSGVEFEGHHYWHTSNWYGERRKGTDWNFMDSYATVVWRDEEMVAKIEADYKEYKKWFRRYTRMENTVILAFESIERQWEVRAKEREYEEFLAEYKDPDLWEGHQKTLNPHRLKFPYKNYSNTHSMDKEPFVRAIEWVVERGISVDGVLVSDVVDLALTRGLRLKTEIPADVMDIKIVLKSKPEDADD